MIAIEPKTFEQHGLIVPEIQENEYKFGDGALGDAPINPSGDWSQWLPSEENQNVGLEPMACTSYALLNCVETMLRQRYGSTLNYSDRFLAYVSGTSHNGNDPHTVAEALRKSGDVFEADYPYTEDINTWEKFYTTPAKWLYTKALEFIAEYSFGHSWVTNPTQQRMMDALTYSPLTAGVYAWQQNADGLYIRPSGAQSGHDVMIYGYVANQYWLCFDSYDSHVKRLAWDFGFDAVKRYTLDRQIVNTAQGESAWTLFKKWFAQVINDLRYGTFGGVSRSPIWSRVRKDFITKNPNCAVCGKMGEEIHHKLPYNLHPELELDTNNLITFCKRDHLLFGHLLSFFSYDPEIEVNARIMRDRILSRP